MTEKPAAPKRHGGSSHLRLVRESRGPDARGALAKFDGNTAILIGLVSGIPIGLVIHILWSPQYGSVVMFLATVLALWHAVLYWFGPHRR